MITKVSQNCVELVKHYESLHDGDLKKIGCQPKLCPAGIVTIGYGRALKDKKGNWLKGEEGMKNAAIIYPDLMNITEEKAEYFLQEDLNEFAKQIVKLCLTYDFDLNQDEFDAIVSFAYNCGAGAIAKGSSLLSVGKMILNKKRNFEDVKKAFLLWVKSNGVTLKGLVNRRNSEAELFYNGILKFFN